MLLHMWLGCCAHHGHAAESVSKPAHTHRHAGHTHRHGDAGTDSQAPSEPGTPHDDCHETHCTFLVKGETPTFTPDMTWAALCVLGPDFVTARSLAPSVRWYADTGDPLTLPVRLHLFHQVLVI
jgi:hypothetical protein